jgi:hypothetical protein
LNFCNLSMPLEASYHNLPNPNHKSNMEFFHLWTTTMSYTCSAQNKSYRIKNSR